MKRFGIGLALALGLVATSASAQDVGSQADQICCGSNCCLIDGTCYTSGEASADDACLVCDPSGSNTTFTNTCVTPDAGGGGGDDGDDGGCSAAGGPAGAYGFALIGAALAFVRRRRR